MNEIAVYVTQGALRLARAKLFESLAGSTKKIDKFLLVDFFIRLAQQPNYFVSPVLVISALVAFLLRLNLFR